MKKVFIMLGGSIENLPSNWQEDTREEDWIGVDRGALHLIQHGIKPKIALGDFDSVTEEEFDLIQESSLELIKVPSEKDLTDTELSILTAIEAEKYDDFVIYAGTGTRLDHMINTFSIPIEERFRPYAEKIIFIDKTNTVTYYLPGEHMIVQDPDKSYVAFGAMVPVRGLTLGKGLKYQLDSVDVSHPYMYASNEFTQPEAEFSFNEGLLMAIQTKD